MNTTAAIKFFRSYGVKCEVKLVEEWLNSSSSNQKGLNENFCEEDLYDFNEWCRWKGTGYEEGIDDKTRIERFIKEINELKSEIDRLNTEKALLEEQLGIGIF
ncbi:hypothetical protein ACTQ5K_11405 [Niallia sp. Sow4_A1]|uniref:hypothetical protein n=1 Tax=unclassified Niallia TaxID=2837522 RepID=UPI002041973A|nr:hypothetical protein [Niallia sp. MER TA 168]MCM3360373.1 hypothetical protein [Niallia sp. MER TA 168]